MSMQIQYSVYDRKFRHDVITTPLAAYKKMRETDEKENLQHSDRKDGEVTREEPKMIQKEELV